jgi:hypothetical protein
MEDQEGAFIRNLGTLLERAKSINQDSVQRLQITLPSIVPFMTFFKSHSQNNVFDFKIIGNTIAGEMNRRDGYRGYQFMYGQVNVGSNYFIFRVENKKFSLNFKGELLFEKAGSQVSFIVTVTKNPLNSESDGSLCSCCCS